MGTKFVMYDEYAVRHLLNVGCTPPRAHLQATSIHPSPADLLRADIVRVLRSSLDTLPREI